MFSLGPIELLILVGIPVGLILGGIILFVVIKQLRNDK